MLYSCTHMAKVGVKGLSAMAIANKLLLDKRAVLNTLNAWHALLVNASKKFHLRVQGHPIMQGSYMAAQPTSGLALCMMQQQESRADANVSARQQCVNESPSEEIYSKSIAYNTRFPIDG